MEPEGFDDVALLQQVAATLLKRFCEYYYNYCKRSFIEPRLELRDLTREDDNIPQDDFYQLIVDGNEEQLILSIEKKGLEENKLSLLKAGEFQFETDLKPWAESNATNLENDGTELFLLRNFSRGKGAGFFEAGNIRSGSSGISTRFAFFTV